MKRFALLLMLVASCQCSGNVDVKVSKSSALEPNARVLDALHDGKQVIAGVPLPAPENADPTLLHRVLFRVDGRDQPWTGPSPIQDARFLPDGAVAVVDADSRLLRVMGDKTEELDTDARAGLDTSDRCGCLVYIRGLDTDAAPVVRDLVTGLTKRRDEDLAPAWSPVIAPDGRSFFVVSSKSGVPAVWRVPIEGGSPQQLTNLKASPLELTPFPEGPEHPLVAGEVIIFEARGVTHALDFEGHIRWSRPELGSPHWRVPSHVVEFSGGRVASIEELQQPGGLR